MPIIIDFNWGEWEVGREMARNEDVDYIKSLEYNKIPVDGKGRATDNAYIERFFKSIEYEYIYLYEIKDGRELFDMCKTYISLYNEQRGHSSITLSHVFCQAT